MVWRSRRELGAPVAPMTTCLLGLVWPGVVVGLRALAAMPEPRRPGERRFMMRLSPSNRRDIIARSAVGGGVTAYGPGRPTLWSL